MFQKEGNHRRGPYGGCAVDGVLSTLVSKASRSRALLGHESTRYIQSVFGGDQVERRLWNMVIRTLCSLSRQDNLTCPL